MSSLRAEVTWEDQSSISSELPSSGNTCGEAGWGQDGEQGEERMEGVCIGGRGRGGGQMDEGSQAPPLGSETSWRERGLGVSALRVQPK